MLKEKKETVLYKKLIFSILVVALLNLVGCYSYSTLYPDPYQEIKKEISEADEIIVNLKNAEKYKFAKGYYYFQNDTLTGEGFAIKSEIEEPYRGKISLSQIGSITVEEVDSEKAPSLVEEIIGITLVIIVIIAFWKIGFNK